MGIGAEVLIIFSGEVIPKIIEVTNPVAPILPTVCPSCDTQLQWKGVDLVCNNIHCGDKNVKSVASFLIKCGVEGVTDTSLTNWGISTFSDLLAFDPDFNSKSQDNFASELSKKVFSKSQEELFANMTFDGAGSTNINKILDHYSIQGDTNIVFVTNILYMTSNSKPASYPEAIGQTTIDKIKTDWIRNLTFLKLIISDRRYNPKPVIKVTGNLSGSTFLITGTLSEGRKQVEARIVSAGGTIASSVSKTLSYLVVGADAGSKLDKATKLGVKILTEDELKGMI